MKVTYPLPGSRPRLGPALLLLSLLAVSCSRKSEEAPPKPEPAPPAAAPPSPEPVPPAEPAAADTPAVPAAPEPAPAKPAFRSKPPAKGWPGRAYAYKPALNLPGKAVFRVAAGPEPMKMAAGAVTWIPVKPGAYPVTLEAAWSNGKDSATIRQSWSVTVEPVLSLALSALPEKTGKGDSVVFDLRGSAFPEWAGPSLTVRFDYEGDGTWDTPALPLPGNLVHRHAYAMAGRFAPKVEALYLDLETRTAQGAIAVISPVEARLSLRPDTVEPGGLVAVDASASKGDGRLVYLLDLDGDGRPEWADSASGKGSLKAPASGRYAARLTVRNPMGQEGTAAAPLVVNARPRAALKLKLSRAHMAQEVEAAIEARDDDDSLRALRINFTGAPDGWVAAAAPDSALGVLGPNGAAVGKGPGRWRKVFRHAYGRTGKFTVEGCAASADGRADCTRAQVEVFNAPPVCEPGGDLKATLGVPAEIEGKGRDPDGSIVKWEWDLDGDGKYDVSSPKDGKVKYTFARKGKFALNLRVTTADGMTATGARQVEVRKEW